MITIQERSTQKIPGITSLFVSFDYDPKIVNEIKLVNSGVYHPECKEWELPLTSLAEFIDRVCSIDSIQLELQETPETTESQELITLSESYKTTPFDYQIEGIRFGLQHSSWLLQDAPGLGKTLQLIYLAEELKQRHGIKHCLIICGINTLKINWKKEIEKHSNEQCTILGQRINRKGEFVVDGIAARLKQLQEPIDEFFVITNIESLRDERIVKALTKGKPNQFDMIVVDEIHKAKSHQSQQGKGLHKLSKATYKIGATGTLLLNSPLDAYSPLKWIGAEKSTFSTFKYYYCTYGGPFNNMLIGYKNLEILQDQLKRYSLRRTKDILGLPPKTVIPEYVELNESQRIFYDNVKEGISQLVDKVKLTSANTLSLVLRLRQATACPSILTTESIESSKIERAIDLVEELVSSGEKVVIFSTFKETVYELNSRLKNLGFDVVLGTGDQTDAEIESSKTRFQEDIQCNVYLGTWQKSGTGITLTAASYMIFIDTPYTAAEFEQACDRIHRIGTTNSVFIYNLICNNTIDERVWELVNDKEALSDYIVDEKITAKGVAILQKYIEELCS